MLIFGLYFLIWSNIFFFFQLQMRVPSEYTKFLKLFCMDSKLGQTFCTYNDFYPVKVCEDVSDIFTL